jgi:hypothetical protein
MIFSSIVLQSFCMNDTILICPRNDEESLMILKIAEKLGLSVYISSQPHGAKLEKEKDLIGKLQDINPDAQKLVIVELPGLKAEQELKDLGYKIIIIDHHRYDDINRMMDTSSLEQFLAHFNVDDEGLVNLGFDAKMVQGVGAIDRGFLWELNKTNLSDDEKKRARSFYRELTMELGGERRAGEEEAARLAWEDRKEEHGIIIIESTEDRLSIRDALSFILADAYPEHPPQVVIKQGSRRLYVQETPHAKTLFETFGGFTFGRDACWGILKEDGSLPSMDEVLAIL